MRKRFILIPLAVLLIAALVGGGVVFSNLQPADMAAKKVFFKVKLGETTRDVLDRAEKERLIKSADALRLYARFFRLRGSPRSGTYEVSAAMPALDIAKKLLGGEPIRQMVLIREGLWASEVADILAAKGVCDAKAFRVLAAQGWLAKASPSTPFLIPGKPIEGYLFPDTYDLPPLAGETYAVERMLAAFGKKVWEPLGKPDPLKLRKWVIVGSLVELEAKLDSERPNVSGVIYNRLAKGMPLQVDATVLYGLKERRRLFFKDYQLDSQYNTYKFKGLPPGPICSPGVASVMAAAHPAQNKYLYYVARPDGSHLFAETYEKHKQNIIRSRKP